MVDIDAKPTVLVTGANGFVGRHLCAKLPEMGFPVVSTVRSIFGDSKDTMEVSLSDSSSRASIRNALRGVSVVVHLAARTHPTDDDSSLESFSAINCRWALRLAEECVHVGVKRFIFLSTIKVLGESTKPGRAFHAHDLASPEDAYARSKLDAERRISDVVSGSGMDLVVIRPPLIYGPGVGSNFHALTKLVSSRVPLPFGAINNRRSLVSIENLVDLILACVSHPVAIREIFLVSDGDDVSTPELIRRIGKAMGISPLLIPLPVSWLTAAATLIGKRAAVARLCGNLQVDIAATQDALNWSPRFTMADTLSRMVSLNGKGII